MLLIYAAQGMTIIDIIDNNDYKINKKINFNNDIYDFNSNLDLLCLDIENKNYYNSPKQLLFKSYSYPDYNKVKFSITEKTNINHENNRLQFINNRQFFHFSSKIVEFYEIKDNKYSKLSAEININSKEASIIELNTDFYCLNDKEKILLLNKTDLVLAKTINLNSNNLGMIKITNKIISIFFSDYNNLVSNTYDILSDGIKWKIKEKKNLLNVSVRNCCLSKNYILFIKRDYYSNSNCTLFEIKTKK